jgi:hypothetical protein
MVGDAYALSANNFQSWLDGGKVEPENLLDVKLEHTVASRRILKPNSNSLIKKIFS